MITIVVLIILATVSIQLSLGNNGIFNRAKTAKEQYQNAQDYEETEISKVTNEIDNNISALAREITYVIPGIDVNNVLQTIVDESSATSWTGHGPCSYTAIQDCYVMGYISCYNSGIVKILINNVEIGRVFDGDTSQNTTVPINYLLKSGDKIEFSASGSNIKLLKAYGIKY